jgi:hypothetical protein
VKCRLLSCREVDRAYRLRNGTAAEAWRQGQLPGRRSGRRILVSATRADELFGLRLQEAVQ